MIELIDLKHAADMVGRSVGPEELGVDGDALRDFVQEQADMPKEWADSGEPGPPIEPLSFARGVAIGVYAAVHADRREEADA